jgi:hypothetical protein
MLAFAVAVVVIAAGAAPLLAQGEFPLKFTEARQNDPLIPILTTVVSAMSGKPFLLKVPPKDLSAKAQYFQLPIGGKNVLAILDAGPLPDNPPEVLPLHGPWKVYVDTAGMGDFSSASPLTLLPMKDGAEAGMAAGLPTFGPVSLAAPDGKSPLAPVRLRVYSPRHLGVSQVGYMAGEVKLDGQSYRVAAVACNGVGGRYDKTLSIPVNLTGKQPEYATFAIDLNQDGKFGRDLMEGTVETLPLLNHIHVKGSYYSVKMAADGSSVTLAKVEPKMGTIDAGSPDVALVAQSDYGIHNLSGAQGKWQVPAGKYQVVQVSLSRADAAGAKWTLSGRGFDGKAGDIEVRPAETLAMKFGPPLVAKVRVTPFAGTDQVGISYAVKGQAGELYGPVARNDKQTAPPPQPELKILDESGKVLAAGQFEFG